MALLFSYKFIMKFYIYLILIGLSLSGAWGQEIEGQKELIKHDFSLKSDESEKSSDYDKFSDLVKTTLDLMGPDLEISQLSEEKTE
jgi:hypothetical protein